MDLRQSLLNTRVEQIGGDRRADRRYPLDLELRYKLIRRRRVLETGVGRTVDLSSGGILFEADRPLPLGLNLELSIEWPALLHNVAPMRLVVTGRIVRTNRKFVAMRTVQHEFRTQGTQFPRSDEESRIRSGGLTRQSGSGPQLVRTAGVTAAGSRY